MPLDPDGPYNKQAPISEVSRTGGIARMAVAMIVIGALFLVGNRQEWSDTSA